MSQSMFRAAVLAAIVLVTGFAADKDKDRKDRHDAFVAGDAGENRIAKEVRHELVMLPYYGVFDDLAFRIETGGTVTLLGQVTRPTLKSDAGERHEKSGGRYEGHQ